MRELVERLCSDECAGREPGTPGGELARRIVLDAFREAGLEPFEQPVPACGGANVLARIGPAGARHVLVAAHFDHLGIRGGEVHRGADDNAAGVAILVDAARRLVADPPGRRAVLFASFDGEERLGGPTGVMGSERYVEDPASPLSELDLMVCMDLVGHAVGPPGAPPEVAGTLFALGAERSAGTAALVDSLARAEPGLFVRRADAEVIPPLSDYLAFWRLRLPFLFLTCGRWRHYHTPGDRPERLDWDKVGATSRWLERLVRAACRREEPRVAFVEDGRDDAATLRTIHDLAGAVGARVPGAAPVRAAAAALLARCDGAGRLPAELREEARLLATAVEGALA